MAGKISSSQYLEYAYDLYKDLKTTEINLAYVGDVTQEVTRNFVVLTEDNLIRRKENNLVQRKVFNVMVESIQNISRHADVMSGDPHETRQGVVLISHNDDCYNIVTGNLVEISKRPILQERLDRINNMDKTELSQAYKKQIQEGTISERGGAGLGFLDIAKKCKQAINFRFYDIPGISDYCIFMTIATVLRATGKD